MSKATVDVLAERQRQIDEEGYGADRDQGYKTGQLARAAVAYLTGAPKLWPWQLDTFKPKDDRRDLVRAAALIIAEIDRLDEAEARAPKPDQAA